MNGGLDLLIAPLRLFVSHPPVAFLPAALFLLYYLVRRPAAARLGVPGQVRWSLAAGLLWVAYGIYEIATAQWARTVAGAPIRVDLFLVVPVLYLLTAAALWSCVSFEISASKGVARVKPFTPGPYARTRNRRFVLGIAIALVSVPLLSLFFWLVARGPRVESDRVVGLLVIAALAFFLVRGSRWAKWCLLLWLAYSALVHWIGWSSLRMTNLPEMGIYRQSHLVLLVLDLSLGGCLVLSRRLREHLDAHS